MISLKLNYYAHTILNNKYHMLFALFIYLFLIIILKNTHIVYCMTEGDVENITSQVAEAKTTRPRVSQVEQVIHNQVTSYLDTASIIEAKDQTIASLEAENKQLKTDLRILAKNYIRVDGARLEEQGLMSNVERILPTDPFFKEDDSLIKELKEHKPFIFQEGGFDPEMDGSNEQEEGYPDLLYYGDVKNPKKDEGDY